MSVPLTNISTGSGGLMRMYLDHSAQDFISVEKEVELLESYIEMVRLSHENRFDFEILKPVNTWLGDYRIPTMILQTYHGECHPARVVATQ